MVQKNGAAFIETMDCLPVSKLPEGPEWTYELKLDGYRLEAVRGEKEVTLYSRRRKVLNGRFSYIANRQCPRLAQRFRQQSFVHGELESKFSGHLRPGIG